MEQENMNKTKGRLRGLHSTIHGGIFKNTDIQRNSILSYTNEQKVQYISKANIKPNPEMNQTNRDIKNLFISPNPSKRNNHFHNRHHSTIDEVASTTLRMAQNNQSTIEFNQGAEKLVSNHKLHSATHKFITTTKKTARSPMVTRLQNLPK